MGTFAVYVYNSTLCVMDNTNINSFLDKFASSYLPPKFSFISIKKSVKRLQSAMYKGDGRSNDQG